MVGFDIASTIVVRRSIEKGTKIVEEPLKKLNFAGVEFKKYQKGKLQIAGDIGLSSSKGTALSTSARCLRLKFLQKKDS